MPKMKTHSGTKKRFKVTGSGTITGTVNVGQSLPAGTEELTRVIALRLGMKDAIACEDYEKAKEDRDAIRALEERWLGPPRA